MRASHALQTLRAVRLWPVALGTARPIANRLRQQTGGLALLALALAVAASLHAQAGHVYDVRDFGAKGDGQTLDTAAIQKALEACGQACGGIVRLSAGTYLSQPLTLRSKTTLRLEAGAKLQATESGKGQASTLILSLDRWPHKVEAFQIVGDAVGAVPSLGLWRPR